MNAPVLKLERFKCFESISVKLSRLTALTGRNSVGKSTITQAIRLYREAISQERIESSIYLNGGEFLLGTFDEIINQSDLSGGSDGFAISLDAGDGAFTVKFSAADDSDECEYVKARLSAPVELADVAPWHFIYLSAERHGPRLRQSDPNDAGTTGLSLGAHGEFAAEVLVNNQTSRVEDGLIHPSLLSGAMSGNALLNSNVEKWLSTIVGEINIRATRPPRLGLPLLEFKRPDAKSDWQFPTSFGFGVSYTLPIILAGLLMPKNGMLIVDSPEAHLHPAAQTAIASFLARIAASGRTVILETHSDHVIDGLRLAIADPEQPIEAADCIFHYLDRDQENGVVHYDLAPREDGSLPKWPVGFFDQTADNLRRMSQIKR
jgi:predicted ATPase